jgi:hypothetical protein
LSRKLEDLPSDGSRIEGSHKGWNSLQRTHACGIVTFEALAHAFVLRRNLRVGYLHRASNLKNEFLVTTLGSHHIHLIDHIAAVWNELVDHHKRASHLEKRPRLPDVGSGEMFGIVYSQHATSFGKLSDVKVENDDDDDEYLIQLEPADVSSLLDDTFQTLQIDPQLLDQPLLRVEPPVNANHQFEAIGLESIKDRCQSKGKLTAVVRAYFQPVVHAELTLVGIWKDGSTLTSIKRKLDEQNMNAPEKKSRLDGTGASQFGYDGSVPVTRSSSTLAPLRVPVPVHPFFSSVPPTSSNAINSITFGHAETPLAHVAVLSSPLPNPISTDKLTRSQRLFSAATQIHPKSLSIGVGDEFFLFMELREEQQWTSFGMTPRKWVSATQEYNTRLQAKNQASVTKQPRALVEKLGEIEPKVLDRLARRDFVGACSCPELQLHAHTDPQQSRAGARLFGGDIALLSRLRNSCPR